MRIVDLFDGVNFLEENIQEGDVFELEYGDFVLETTVIGLKSDGPIIAVDATALAYIPLEEAKYHGRTVPLGKPMKGDVKKSKVYVKDPSTGNVKKVNFGDKKLSIKKHLPGHRKSFRARHHCENPGPRTKARFWSCRAW